MNNLRMLNTPDKWTLWRIEGRKHDEVVSHVSLDEGRSFVCGRQPRDDMVLDDNRVWLPGGGVYSFHGGTTVVHRVCASCMNALHKMHESK